MSSTLEKESRSPYNNSDLTVRPTQHCGGKRNEKQQDDGAKIVIHLHRKYCKKVFADIRRVPSPTRAMSRAPG